MHPLPVLACLLALVTSGAVAEPPIPPTCALERLERARAACILLTAERIERATQHDLRVLAARTQSASAAEIRAYEQNLAETYSEHRTDTANRCHADTALERAICRLSAARERAARAARQIAEAERALGLSPTGGGAVRLEIRPLPGGGFELDVILDGVVPLAPDIH